MNVFSSINLAKKDVLLFLRLYLALIIRPKKMKHDSFNSLMHYLYNIACMIFYLIKWAVSELRVPFSCSYLFTLPFWLFFLILV